MEIKNINNFELLFNTKSDKDLKKENTNMKSLIIEVQKERTKSENIARKIAKGEAINDDELKYIREKNPELLNKAEEAKEKVKNLKLSLESAKTKENAKELLYKAKSGAIQLMVTENINISFQGKLELEEISKINYDVVDNRKRKKLKILNELV